MAFVRIKSGILKIASRAEAPGYPDQGLPGEPVYPDQGLPGEPEYPSQGLPGFPDYPSQGLPGFPDRPAHPIFPPLRPPVVSLPIPPSPEYPMVPIPPEAGEGTPGHLPALPPGTIWPPLRPEFPPDLGSKYLVAALVWVAGHGYKAHWIVVDTDARPTPPIEPPVAQPK
jgi:hypothetical protein